MKLKTFKNLNLKNKKVLLRVNFDLPIKNGKILDDSRIRAHLPTIFYLIKKKAKIILISHLNDPQKIHQLITNNTRLTTNKSKLALKIKKRFSLKVVADYLNKLKVDSRQLKVRFVDDCLGEKIKKEIEKLKSREVILLENLRFYKEEEENDKIFAKKLAGLADFYINDAFPVSHRNHASVSAVTKFLSSYAGLLLEKELKNLSQVLERPKHPFIILIGGAKISTKLLVIKNFLKIADQILIGGALANTFFKAKGLNIAQSAYEKKMIKEVKKLLRNKKIILPTDVKIKLNIKNKKQKIQIKNVKIEELNKLKDFMILDIGEEAIKLFSNFLKSAKMIVWNGPMGYFEEKPFDLGTKKIAEEILKNKKAKIFIGGGETLAALRQIISNLQFLISRKNIFISTGGGAMLEFLTGKILPGIKPLIF